MTIGEILRSNTERERNSLSYYGKFISKELNYMKVLYTMFGLSVIKLKLDNGRFLDENNCKFYEFGFLNNSNSLRMFIEHADDIINMNYPDIEVFNDKITIDIKFTSEEVKKAQQEYKETYSYILGMITKEHLVDASLSGKNELTIPYKIIEKIFKKNKMECSYIPAFEYYCKYQHIYLKYEGIICGDITFSW